MRVIAKQAVQEAVTLADARDVVRDAFRALHEGSTISPDEFAMAFRNGGELHIKGAHVGGRWAAFKVATGQFPDAPNSGFTVVIDANTGETKALLDDEGWLTEIRTAAASAVAATALARPDSHRLALLGAGIQAGYQVDALRDCFEISSVTVWSRTFESAQRFADAHGAVAVSTVEEAVATADIVICCTPSTEPLLSLGQIRPGTHVTAVGSDTAGKRELADDLLSGCDVLVCDLVAVSQEVGELHHVPQATDRSVDLGAVLAGEHPGRTNPADITVADLCGLGIQDAAIAGLVLDNL